MLYASARFTYLPNMTRTSKFPALLAALAVATGVFTDPVAAQFPIQVDPGSSVRTRADLEQLLLVYEDAISSPAYSNNVKDDLRFEVTRIRTRLTQGDFRLGDRITLTVAGEEDLPDTVSVESGPKISLGLFGDVDLKGALRSEVEERITESLRAYLRNPLVEAQALMRVSIQGAVAAPGFYTMPASTLVGEALMVAGGTGPTSDLSKIKIERGPVVLIEREDLNEAIRVGYSLDQLNMQAGDQITVPLETGSFFTRLGVITGVVGSLGFLILQLTGGS